MFWLLACLSPSDTTLHQQAIQAGDQSDCSAIDSPDLRGDCLSWQASALAEHGDVEQATQLCSGMQESQWRGECWFMVADAAKAMPEQATALCQHAELYERQCMDHAVQRLAETLLKTPGSEMAALAELTESWTPVYGQAEAADRSKALVSDLMERRPHPLGRATFGNADKELVQMTLTHHLAKRSCSVLGLDAEGLEAEIEEALLAASTTRKCAEPGGPAGL